MKNEWGGFAPGFERAVIEDVASGDVDIAWIGTRALDLVGEDSLQALTAPFLVDSEPLQEAILESDLPSRMLDSVEIENIVPLAILAGGLRRPFSVDAPLTNSSAFDGAVFQSFESELNEASTRALGATPVHDVPEGLDAGLEVGSIQGFEKQFSTVIINGTNRLAPFVAANVVLWPETIVLIANADRLTRLSDRQRAWLSEAAEATALASVANLPDDAESFSQFCAAGGRAGIATDAELAGLRQAVAPVYDELRRDAETAGFLDEIVALKAKTDSAPLVVPEGCTGPAPVDAAPENSAEAAAEIEGVYRWELTAEDADAAGRPDDSRYPWPWLFTMTLDDGRWSHRVRDPENDADYGGGPYTVNGDQLTLTWDGGYPMHFTFERLDDGSLRLTPTDSTIAEDAFVMTTHDWVRID